MYHTFPMLLSKYPTISQVEINKSVGVKGACKGNAACISLLVLANKAGSVLSRYQTFPVSLLSASAQNGATIFLFPPSGNGSEVN